METCGENKVMENWKLRRKWEEWRIIRRNEFNMVTKPPDYSAVLSRVKLISKWELFQNSVDQYIVQADKIRDAILRFVTGHMIFVFQWSRPIF